MFLACLGRKWNYTNCKSQMREVDHGCLKRRAVHVPSLRLPAVKRGGTSTALSDPRYVTVAILSKVLSNLPRRLGVELHKKAALVEYYRHLEAFAPASTATRTPYLTDCLRSSSLSKHMD